MRDVDIALPRPHRAAWVVLILAGVVSALLGALLLAADFQALLDGASLIGAFLFLGAGLFLSCFGLLVGFNRERPTAMRVSSAAITLEDASGDRVRIPWTEVERAACLPTQGDDAGWVVALNKRDGGLLELVGSRSREEAERIVVAMAEARGDETTELEASSPEAHLDHIRGVTAVRAGDGLELSWGATVPRRQLLIFGPVLGMALIIFGFHREQGGLGTLLATAFMGLMAGLVLASIVRLLGVRQRIHVDARQLTIEKRRGKKTVEQTSVPTFSVVTIDYTHQLTVIGAQLNLRTAEARDHHDAAMGAVTELGEDPNPIQLAKALSSLMKRGVQVPMGSLSLPAKIGVDLALSAEVARRTGKSSAAV